MSLSHKAEHLDRLVVVVRTGIRIWSLREIFSISGYLTSSRFMQLWLDATFFGICELDSHGPIVSPSTRVATSRCCNGHQSFAQWQSYSYSRCWRQEQHIQVLGSTSLLLVCQWLIVGLAYGAWYLCFLGVVVNDSLDLTAYVRF